MWILGGNCMMLFSNHIVVTSGVEYPALGASIPWARRWHGGAATSHLLLGAVHLEARTLQGGRPSRQGGAWHHTAVGNKHVRQTATSALG